MTVKDSVVVVKRRYPRCIFGMLSRIAEWFIGMLLSCIPECPRYVPVKAGRYKASRIHNARFLLESRGLLLPIRIRWKVKKLVPLENVSDDDWATYQKSWNELLSDADWSLVRKFKDRAVVRHYSPKSLRDEWGWIKFWLISPPALQRIM